MASAKLDPYQKTKVSMMNCEGIQEAKGCDV